MRTLLLLDTSFLAYRAFHTTGGLSHKEVKTGVMYGILREIIGLKDHFDTDHVAFCFDSKYSLRKEIFEGYKGDRVTGKDDDKFKALLGVKRQLTKLRKEYLPDIGFRNLFIQKGYEADDIIAKISKDFASKTTKIIIVSADSDMYQLLNDNVSLWNPIKRKLTTPSTIFKEYGITPDDWAKVRALAGGKDGLKGIPRVGPLTACRYVLNELPDKMKQHIDSHLLYYHQSKKLVTLPFKGTKSRKIKKDQITMKSWTEFTERFGLRSMRRYFPIRTKSRRGRAATKKLK